MSTLGLYCEANECFWAVRWLGNNMGEVKELISPSRLKQDSRDTLTIHNAGEGNIRVALGEWLLTPETPSEKVFSLPHQSFLLMFQQVG